MKLEIRFAKQDQNVAMPKKTSEGAMVERKEFDRTKADLGNQKSGERHSSGSVKTHTNSLEERFWRNQILATNWGELKFVDARHVHRCSGLAPLLEHKV